MGGAPAIGQIFTQRVVIGVGDQAVSNNANVVLSTYALGSCVGVVMFDRQTSVGGILHVMLPEAKISPDKAKAQPAMFADSGLVHFFRAIQAMGGNTRRSKLLIAGGASVLSSSDLFKIGDRNAAQVKAILSRSGIRPVHEDTGGVNNRTLHLTLSTGMVELKLPTGTKQISLQ